MPRQNIIGGSSFEDQIGYCRAVVVDDDWIIVSGTTGYNYATGEISPDIMEQAEQTLRNIDKALQDAGSCMADVTKEVVWRGASGGDHDASGADEGRDED
ncbi:hypothetical protein ARSEF4850_006103 [Beauveria asiatica]